MYKIHTQTNKSMQQNRKSRNKPSHLWTTLFIYLFAFYESSQARGRIGAAAASLHHSHSNMRSKPHL